MGVFEHREGLLSTQTTEDEHRQLLLPKRSQSTSVLLGRLPYNAERSRDDALSSRYRYYTRLDPHSDSLLRIPSHIAPSSANFFSVLPFTDKASKQGSLVTIFSIWNALVGSALLTMPWAFAQAGFFLGIAIFCLMPVIAFYTAYLVIRLPEGLKLGDGVAFTDVCRHFWGARVEKLTVVFSLCAFAGGVIVYWILMSNFLFSTGTVIYESLLSSPNDDWFSADHMKNATCGVICASDDTAIEESIANDSLFHSIWQLKTVPVFLVIIVLPLLMFKDAMFFQKFNGSGTISVIYIVMYVLIKAFKCGIHINFSDPGAVSYAKGVDSHFWALTGTLTISLFIHNSILSIMQHNRHPENNVRDLSWAFALTSITYFIVGAAVYVSFPLVKTCISDNLLNNYLPSDILSSVARLFLLFQILTVFTLFSFLIRAQVFSGLLGIANPKKRWILLTNLAILALCALVAIVLPTVGTILRFSGSFIGLVYMFILPCAAHLKKLQLNEQLTWPSIIFHGFIIALGVINCIGQFLIF